MAIVIYGDALDDMPAAIFDFEDYLLKNKSEKLEIVIDGKTLYHQKI